MPLWDDVTGSQPQQSSPSLWGWLTSLFSGRPNLGSYPPTTNPFNRWDPVQAAAPSPATPGGTSVYTGPMVTPSLYPGSAPTANWAAGTPASLRYAPPSMYTAADPQQQARWQQASTPAGYAALAAGGGTPAVAAAPATRAPFIPPVPPPKPQPPPVITGPGNIMPPYGGTQGWAGAAPGVPQGLPGSPSGPGVLPPSSMPPAPPASAYAPLPAAASAPIPPPDITKMTTQEIEAMPNAVYNNLTEAQRTQLRDRWLALNPNR